MLRRILRVSFSLLYNEFSFSYDLVSWIVSVSQWREWQRQVIPFIVGDTVLEVAHGTGDLQIDLAVQGHKPIAFDLSPFMGRIAKRKLARRNLFPPFVRGSVMALPFPFAHFTTIVSTFPSEFIVDPAVVREFKRVLVGGGRVVFVPAATIIPGHLADRAAQWLFEVTGQSTAPELDGGGWPPRLAQVYQAAGFEVKFERVALPRSLVWVVVAQA